MKNLTLFFVLTISLSLFPVNFNNSNEEIILEELNVKKISLAKSEEKKIELDTRITPELEAEGIARELTRTVQAARKKTNLVKEDLIDLEITFNHELKEKIEKYFLEEQKRVGAKNIFFGEKNEKVDYSEEGKIRNTSYKISFSKL